MVFLTVCDWCKNKVLVKKYMLSRVWIISLSNELRYVAQMIVHGFFKHGFLSRWRPFRQHSSRNLRFSSWFVCFGQLPLTVAIFVTGQLVMRFLKVCKKNFKFPYVESEWLGRKFSLFIVNICAMLNHNVSLKLCL